MPRAPGAQSQVNSLFKAQGGTAHTSRGRACTVLPRVGRWSNCSAIKRSRRLETAAAPAAACSAAPAHQPEARRRLLPPLPLRLPLPLVLRRWGPLRRRRPPPARRCPPPDRAPPCWTTGGTAGTAWPSASSRCCTSSRICGGMRPTCPTRCSRLRPYRSSTRPSGNSGNWTLGNGRAAVRRGHPFSLHSSSQSESPVSSRAKAAVAPVSDVASLPGADEARAAGLLGLMVHLVSSLAPGASTRHGYASLSSCATAWTRTR